MRDVEWKHWIPTKQNKHNLSESNLKKEQRKTNNRVPTTCNQLKNSANQHLVNVLMRVMSWRVYKFGIRHFWLTFIQIDPLFHHMLQHAISVRRYCHCCCRYQWQKTDKNVWKGKNTIENPQIWWKQWKDEFLSRMELDVEIGNTNVNQEMSEVYIVNIRMVHLSLRFHFFVQKYKTTTGFFDAEVHLPSYAECGCKYRTSTNWHHTASISSFDSTIKSSSKRTEKQSLAMFGVNATKKRVDKNRCQAISWMNLCMSILSVQFNPFTQLGFIYKYVMNSVQIMQIQSKIQKKKRLGHHFCSRHEWTIVFVCVWWKGAIE